MLQSIKMNNVLKRVVGTTHFIRTHVLNQQQFAFLLCDLECHYEVLPYCIEIRWLSCHKVLRAPLISEMK
jgi:hypothetical protein